MSYADAAQGLLLALLGMTGFASLWLFPALLLQGTLATLFLGVLTAVPVGFTLKAPQLFALMGLLAHSLQWLLQRVQQKSYPYSPVPLSWGIPFGVMVLSFLPSFYRLSASEAALNADSGGVRLLFNLLLLLCFVCFALLRLRTPEQLLTAVKLGLLSCGLSLGFGFLQQLGFYGGIYDPFAYLGSHQSLVDFYGPFFRFSPGTFANEYGEILQTSGFFALMLLYLPRSKSQSNRVSEAGFRWPYGLLLCAIIVALILNFTRASWLVFAVGALIQLAYARFSTLRLLGVAIAGVSVLGVLFYVSQQVLELSLLLQINARFEELGSPQAYSAGQRLQTWALAWEAFLKAPWVGQGLGKFVQTHNVPLQLLAETGLVGFTGFYGLMGWCLLTLHRAYRLAIDPFLRSLLWTSGLGLLGCLAFDLTNHGIYHFVLWYCIALGLAAAGCVFRGEQETLEAAEY